MKLKDCPFCGSEPELSFGHAGDESIAYVICRVPRCLDYQDSYSRDDEVVGE